MIEEERVSLPAVNFSQIPMSPNLAATLGRASELAGASGAGAVSLEHVLLALCDDPDADAVLMASRVDVGRLKSETYGYLSSVAQQYPGSGLGVSPALTRILEAAAAAARGGRRRDINGAIVLAAIVGDGKSAAAQILQAQGLTFDEAIRALQSALATPRDAAPDLRPADDVLARARERVQSRAAPTLRDIMHEPPGPMAQPPLQPMLIPEPRPYSQPVTNSDAFGQKPQRTPESESLKPTPPESAEEPSPQSRVAAANHGHSPGRGNDASAVAGTPSTESEKPKVGSSYIHPADRPMSPPPPVAAQPSVRNERAIPLDLNRPAPTATPPPIPPPIPQPAANYGAPHPSAFKQQRPALTPPIPARLDQRGPAPRGGMQLGPQDRSNTYGNMDAQLGRMPGPPPPPMRSPGPMGGAPSPQPPRGGKPKVETGQLAENIPRRMRIGKTERVEIRLAKASARAITQGLDGGGVAWRHDVTVTQAMSVRLRAADGGFFIETVSPETQWIENQLGFDSDEFASWRFLVTPQTRGRARLQIIVSARTIGADGMAAETALPDQVIDVKVRTNYRRTFARLLGWIVAAAAGGAVAKFADGGLDIAREFMQKFIH